MLAGSALTIAGVSTVFFRVPFFGIFSLSPDLSAFVTVCWVVGMANALNLIDVGSHEAANDILETVRPPLLAASLATMWSTVGVPTVAQFDNHANFRGGIQPAWQHFSPIVAILVLTIGGRLLVALIRG